MVSLLSDASGFEKCKSRSGHPVSVMIFWFGLFSAILFLLNFFLDCAIRPGISFYMKVTTFKVFGFQCILFFHEAEASLATSKAVFYFLAEFVLQSVRP